MAMIKRPGSFPAFGSLMSDFFDNDDFFGSGSFFPASRMPSGPAVNVKETDNSYELEVAAPGIPKEDLHVHVENNVLCIEGNSSYEKEDKDNGRYTRREFGSTSFQRRFTLPDNVDPANIKAKCSNGILNIALPKREDSRNSARKHISIS